MTAGLEDEDAAPSFNVKIQKEKDNDDNQNQREGCFRA
jgi:hypothetical protein